MSHELRTPMNHIIGYSEMLAEDAEDDGNDQYIDDINKIRDSGEHLLGLLNDILNMSKIEAGQMDMFLETFSLSKFLQSVVSSTRTLVENNGNKYEFSALEDMGEMHADLTKVRQCLFNLVSNAAKFTKDGTITLSAEWLEDKATRRIRFAVSDTGIGIEQDKFDYIFKEFAQADESTTRDVGGTGMGLALVKSFCDMMGGKIWVESVIGEGSSFIFELPETVIDPVAGDLTP
jgi:signal transduction histidine kinase